MNFADMIQEIEFNTSLDGTRAAKIYFQRGESARTNLNTQTTPSLYKPHHGFGQQAKNTSVQNSPQQPVVQERGHPYSMQQQAAINAQYQISERINVTPTSPQQQQRPRQVQILQQNQQILELQQQLDFEKDRADNQMREITDTKAANNQLQQQILDLKRESLDMQTANQKYESQHSQLQEQSSALQEQVGGLHHQIQQLTEQLRVAERDKLMAESGARKLIELLSDQQMVSLQKSTVEPLMLTSKHTTSPRESEQFRMRQDKVRLEDENQYFGRNRNYILGLEKGFGVGAGKPECCKVCGSEFCRGCKKVKAKPVDRAAAVIQKLKAEKLEMQQNINTLMKQAYTDPAALAQSAETVKRLVKKVKQKEECVKDLTGYRKSVNKFGVLVK